jgi:hypothetical protein
MDKSVSYLGQGYSRRAFLATALVNVRSEEKEELRAILERWQPFLSEG